MGLDECGLSAYRLPVVAGLNFLSVKFLVKFYGIHSHKLNLFIHSAKVAIFTNSCALNVYTYNLI